MKQETLEEVAERIFPIKLMYFPKEVIDLNEEPRNIFFKGAKWQQDNSNINALNFEIDALKKQIELLKYQQERMYSEEDMKEAFSMGRTGKTIEDFNIKFKNK